MAMPKKKLPVEFALPSWIDPEVWAEFENMRNRIKKPMTEYAKKLIVRTLEKCKPLGQDPNDCLDKSTVNDWTDVYPKKPEPGPDDEPIRSGVWARKLGDPE